MVGKICEKGLRGRRDRLNFTQASNTLQERKRTNPGVGLVERRRLEAVQKDRLDRVAQRIRVAVAATYRSRRHTDPVT